MASKKYSVRVTGNGNDLSLLRAFTNNLIAEIERFNVEDTIKGNIKKRVLGGTASILDKLTPSFWEGIRKDISSFLIENYEKIKITNSPKYMKWKIRAMHGGYKVKTTAKGGKAAVRFMKPSLRTGYLKNSLYKIRLDVTKFRSGSKNSIRAMIIYSNDFWNDYDVIFAERVAAETGFNYMDFTNQQLTFIYRKIMAKVRS